MSKSLVMKFENGDCVVAFSNSYELLEDIKIQAEELREDATFKIVPTVVYKIVRIEKTSSALNIDLLTQDILDKLHFKVNFGLCYSFSKIKYSELSRNSLLYGLQLINNNINNDIIVTPENRKVYEELKLLSEIYPGFAISENPLSEDENYTEDGIVNA